MSYIIENANILKGNRLKKFSLLINKNRIVQMRPAFRQFQHMKMDAHSYIMTRPQVIYVEDIPFQSSFIQLKNYYIHSFIIKGCTTIITSISIQYESELSEKLNTIRKGLLDCPVDYVIAVKIPVRLLTSTFIRKCKREKIPAIIVEVDQMDELIQLPWGWIREAMFPYFAPLVPIFKKDKVAYKEQWKQLMKQENIPTYCEGLENGSVISDPLLKKIGIYPLKGNLFTGGEVSYNFYLKTESSQDVDESTLFLYDNNRLVVTVHKGIVIRAGKEIDFRSDLGSELKISTPSFFVAT